jgi:integrase
MKRQIWRMFVSLGFIFVYPVIGIMTKTTSMNFDDIIDSYLHVLPKLTNNEMEFRTYVEYLAQQDLKLSTIRARTWSLAPFFHYIKDKHVTEVNKRDIEGFNMVLKHSGKKKSTIRKNMIETRDFLNFLYPDNDFFSSIKFRKEKPDTSKKEYINSSDVAEMLKFCVSQRDRCFIFLMWESAGRLGEVLSLNVGDVKPDKYGVTITVTGKTGKRDIPLIDSVPDIQLWLNILKGKPDDPLFPIKNGRLAVRGAQTIVTKLGIKAHITKPCHCHSFRHGRLTELSNLGMSEPQMRLYAGWEADSQMSSTYIHVSADDVKRKVWATKGIKEIEDTKVEAITTARLCVRCGHENPFDSKYCSKCSAILDSLEAMSRQQFEAEFKDRIISTLIDSPILMSMVKTRMKQQEDNNK